MKDEKTYERMYGDPPDSKDFWHDNIRKDCIWPNLMAGGAGSGFYYGENFPNSDDTCSLAKSFAYLGFITDSQGRSLFHKSLRPCNRKKSLPGIAAIKDSG